MSKSNPDLPGGGPSNDFRRVVASLSRQSGSLLNWLYEQPKQRATLCDVQRFLYPNENRDETRKKASGAMNRLMAVLDLKMRELTGLSVSLSVKTERNGAKSAGIYFVEMKQKAPTSAQPCRDVGQPMQESPGGAPKTMPPDARHDGTSQNPVSPAIQKRLNELAPFRDIEPKSWQEIPRVECPHPYPDMPDGNNSSPPFQRNLRGDIFFVAGWKIRLQPNIRYRVTCDFVRNKVWPEVEIVLYQRVPHTEMWQRAASFGSVTSSNRASEVAPQVEEWLITCWGKNVIADDAPWFHFIPETFDLNTAARLLWLHFSAPDRQGGEGGLPASTSAAESSPVVYLKAIE